MNERLVTELETAIADAGTLLVRAQKYCRGVGPEGAALLQATMALGDSARRLSRRDALDDRTAADLQAEAARLAAAVRALIASIHASPEYVAAVAAHAAGEQATLARTLPLLFAGLEPAPAPPALFHTITWRRRNRPRPAREVTADVAKVRDQGLAAEGDDLSPGTDPRLPAVVLRPEWPAEEPVTLRIAPASVPVPIYRLADTGEHLVYVPQLRTTYEVVLAAALGPDALEAMPLDYARYRAELAAALSAAAIPFTDA